MTLLDTNVLIHYLKGLQPVTSRLISAARSQMAIPGIVAYELEYGTLKTGNVRRRTMLAHVLAGLEEVPFDRAAARAAAAIRIALEKAGAGIGPLDLLIAGTAVSRGAALATNNIAEFARVPNLKVVDWSR